MPIPDDGLSVQNIIHKGCSISFIDYKSGTMSTQLKSAGGDVSRGDAESLAGLLGALSNACYNRVEIHNRIEWKDQDLRFFDDAEASVSEVLVIVLLHDTDPAQNQEILIPAYDASLLIPGTKIVNLTNPALIAAANAALGIVNDDDNLANPANYNGWRAFVTTRKAGGARAGKQRNLPAPTEPGDADAPPDDPGEV